MVSFTIKATFAPINNSEYPFTYIRKNGPYIILGEVKVNIILLIFCRISNPGRLEGTKENKELIGPQNFRIFLTKHGDLPVFVSSFFGSVLFCFHPPVTCEQGFIPIRQMTFASEVIQS